MENNNKNNIFVKAFVFVVLAIILTVGVTYAYFRATITGVESESTISIGGATLKIVYEGTETINAENVIPGWSAKKYFNVDVTNTSGKEISYDINLVVENNNFDTEETMNSWLEFSLYECNSTEDKVCDTYLTDDWIYTQSGDQLVYSATTKTSVKTYYALEIEFPNLDEEQSQTGTDGNPLYFSGYVTLTSTKEVYLSEFEKDDWSTIASNIRSGNMSKYKVGDEKEVDIDIDGNGTKESYTVRIANNSNYDCSLESKTACGFVVEFVDIVENRAMNSSNTSVGGWPAMAMRTYLNGTFKSKLPSDLQSAIIVTTVVSGHGSKDSSNFTSTDKIYLLSTGEIWSDCTTGNCYDTASYPYNENGAITTRQLDYYSNKSVSTSSNRTYAVKNFNGAAAWWWLRAASSNTINGFRSVYSLGNCIDIAADSTRGGLAPAFRIG